MTRQPVERPYITLLALLLAALLLLPACGGGGGGGSKVGPTAAISGPATALEFEEFTLEGAGSSAGSSAIRNYAWAQLSGPVASLDGAATDSLRVIAPKVQDSEALVFELRVTDGNGKEDTAEIQVIVTEERYLLHAGVYDADDDDRQLVPTLTRIDSDWSRELPLSPRRMYRFVPSPNRKMVAVLSYSAEALVADRLDIVRLADTPELVYSFEGGFVDGRKDTDGLPDSNVRDVSWSPGGDTLVIRAGQCAGSASYAYARDCVYNLYAWDSASGETTPLTELVHVDNDGDGRSDQFVSGKPSWNSDGNRLAYEVEWNDPGLFKLRRRRRVYTVDPDGSDPRDAIDFDNDRLDNAALYGSGRLVLTPDGIPDSDSDGDGISEGSSYLVAWAPAGDRMLLTANLSAAGVTDLYVVDDSDQTYVSLTDLGLQDADGNGVVDSDYFSGDGISDADVFNAAWSPLGDRLAYTVNDQRFATMNIYMVGSDGSNRVRLLDSSSQPNIDVWPVQLTWSHAGDRLAFPANTQARYRHDLYVSDGTPDGALPITLGSGTDPLLLEINQLRWAGDDSRVGFMSYINGSAREEYFSVDPADPAGLTTVLAVESDDSYIVSPLVRADDTLLAQAWTVDAGLPNGGYYQVLVNDFDGGNPRAVVAGPEGYSADNNGMPGDEGFIQAVGWAPGGGIYVVHCREGDFAYGIDYYESEAAEPRPLTPPPPEIMNIGRALVYSFIGPER